MSTVARDMSHLPVAFEVLCYWWQAGPSKWFAGGEAFDSECRARFSTLLDDAATGALDDWAEAPHGALALIIVLDQFSRNIHRGTPRAFAQDARALAHAERALARGFDLAYPAPARNFFYMPFMHAEDLAAQIRCVELFRALGERESYFYALVHYEAIARFGRFPHRNAILGRETSEEERHYLENGGFSG